MRSKKVLVLFKRTNYQNHLLEAKRHPHSARNPLIISELNRIRKAQATHLATLKFVKDVLIQQGLKFVAVSRGLESNYREFKFIITVGGDGTFLEASRYSRPGQVILGVNSVPTESVGRFCIANPKNFKRVLKKVLDSKHTTKNLHRLKMTVNGKLTNILSLNDILITHQNPAVLSRYFLKAGRICEEQRSSGLWISTAAGSSGAMKSAGGRLLPPYSEKFQYLPRELYNGRIKRYRLKGGVLKPNQEISIISLMREGMVYIDGAHVNFPFPYGTTLKVGLSAYPIKTIEV